MKRFICTIGALLSGATFLSAQDVLPVSGTDFWLGFMNNYEVQAEDEALDIYIVSEVATSGVVSLPLGNWSTAFEVIPGLTTIVNIPNAIAEVYDANIVQGRGVHISSLDPVSVYNMNFKNYTADGTRVLPSQNLTENYMVMAYEGLDGYDYASEILVVATADSSIVQFELTAPSTGGQLEGAIFEVVLNAGEVYQLKGASGSDDFTGTLVREINAENGFSPLAVFSGSSCANVPVGCYACDHMYEQNDPLESWGTSFQIAPPVPATGYALRVLASGDNTVFTTADGTQYSLESGEYLTLYDVNGPECIQSNLPICVGLLMQGITCVGYGDPALTMVADVHQKVEGFTFSTVESVVIYEHMLAIIVSSTDTASVMLDGVLVDPSLFIPFPYCEDHSYANISVAAGNHNVNITAGNGFIAYVYGTGSAESYMFTAASTLYFEQGFPVGMHENDPLSIQLFPNPSESSIEISGNMLMGENPSIEICDLTGMVVECTSTVSNTDRIRIDISELSEGIYVLSITNGKGSIEKRFVKR